MLKSNKPIEIVGNSQNRIAIGTTITGDIVSEAGFRIDGEIIGSLKTSTKVVIGKDGKIDGTLECISADIEGSFTGTLKVEGLLSLKSSATIEGEVVTDKLSVEPGATFNATCSMGGVVKSVSAEKKEEKPVKIEKKEEAVENEKKEKSSGVTKKRKSANVGKKGKST